MSSISVTTMKTTKPELLAPAGSPEGLLAALRCGADAVYLGGEAFNARTTAHNFNREELIAAGKECKLRGVKCYVTLNTMLSDAELPNALLFAQEAIAAGADALIVQDLGLMQLLRERFPGIRIHASTQCSVQTKRGMALLAQLGCNRVVLPRECTKAEIMELINTAPLELEAFVHGALCVSVSGQCLMSAAFGGRSGNRGNCAQPCRLPWSQAINDHSEATYALSLKDLSLLNEINESPLNQLASFKIEGRQKRPEYVAAAVCAFRAAIDATPSPITQDELRQAFSRDGFTQGYYQNARGKDMFGVRQKADLATPELLKKARQLYAKEVACVPIDMKFWGEIGSPITLAIATRGQSVTVEGDVLQPAQGQPLSEEMLRKQLAKLGGTVFYASEIMLELSEGAWLPIRAINALRRRALDEIKKHLCYDTVAALQTCAASLPQSRDATAPSNRGSLGDCSQKLYLRFCSHAQIPDELPKGAKVFLPCETSPEILKKHGAQVTIPTGIFGAHETVLQQLCEAKKAGVSEAMAHTLDGVALALEAGLNPIAGEGMNLCNRASLSAVAALGVQSAVASAEITAAGLKKLKERPPRKQGAFPVGAMVYGRLRLMLVRNALLSRRENHPGLRPPLHGGELLDRKGVRFPVQMRGDCANVYNSRPLWLADVRGSLPNMDFALMSFTVESQEECTRAIAAWEAGGKCDGAFTRGWWK